MNLNLNNNLKNVLIESSNKNLRYCLYKSLLQVDQDLAGLRGDIDLLIHPEDFDSFCSIVQSNGFYKVRNRKHETYFILPLIENQSFIIFDLQSRLRLGRKPLRYLYADCDSFSSTETNMFGIPQVNSDLSGAISFLTRISSDCDKALI